MSPTAPPSAASSLEHEHDEQHDEHALCDLARGADQDRVPEPGRGRDRPQPVDPLGDQALAGRALGRARLGGAGATRRDVATSPWPGRGCRRRARPTATNVSASTITMPVRPPSADGEAAERRPDEPRDVLARPRSSAFAAASWPGATRLGTRASVAGPQTLREHGLAGRDEVHDPQAVGRGDGEEREQENRLEERRRDEDPAAVDPVHQDARHLADEQGGDRLDHEHRRGRQGGAGELEHEHRQADEQHPVAEVADEAADPQAGEVRVPQRRRGRGRRRRSVAGHEVTGSGNARNDDVHRLGVRRRRRRG